MYDIRIITKYSFIVYAFDIIIFNILCYILGQTLQSLTLTKPISKVNKNKESKYCKTKI
jgi:hypothetical protein